MTEIDFWHDSDAETLFQTGSPQLPVSGLSFWEEHVFIIFLPAQPPVPEAKF